MGLTSLQSSGLTMRLVGGAASAACVDGQGRTFVMEDELSIQVRHVVTGRDASGKSVVVSDEATPGIEVGAIPGSQFHMVWGTDECRATVGTDPP